MSKIIQSFVAGNKKPPCVHKHLFKVYGEAGVDVSIFQ